MVENGSYGVNQSGKQIVNVYRDENPKVIIPKRLISRDELQIAKDFTQIPPLSNTDFCSSEKYIALPLNEISQLFPQSTLGDNSEERQETDLKMTQSGLVIAAGMDILDPEKNNRTVRQVQRVGQYERMTIRMDTLEQEMDSYDSPHNKKLKREEIARLRRITESMLANELRLESFTKSIVEGKNESRLPSASGAANFVAKMIKEMSFCIEDILDEVEQILREGIGREIDKGLVGKVAEKAKDQKAKDPEIRVIKEEEEREKEEYLKQEAENIVRNFQNQQSKKPYPYDPDLDEPSREAAEYVAELLKRPF